MDTPLSRLRVLVVEDHAFQRSMLEQALAALGVSRVRAAANGNEALRILREPQACFDIVISDLMMPGVDGIELLPLLRKAAGAISLVLASSDEAVLPAAEAIAKGHGLRVLATLVKPMTPEKLRLVLHRYLADQAAGPGAQ